jgi:hypothetical protein
MVVWYVVDSALSVATGFPLTRRRNTLILAAFLAPVLGSGVLGSPAAATRSGRLDGLTGRVRAGLGLSSAAGGAPMQEEAGDFAARRRGRAPRC